MQKRNTNLLGALLTTFGGICWGVSGSIGQYLFTHEGMDSRWLVPVRLGLAGIILLIYALFRRGRRTMEPWKTAEDRRDLLIYGIAGVSLCQYMYFRTIQLSSAAVGTIMQDLSPIFIMMATCVLESRQPRPREITAIILALCGVFLISTHGDPAHMKIPPAALFTGVMSAVCVTIYNVYPRRLLNTYPVYLLQAWAFILGSVFFTFVFRSWNYPTVITLRGAIGIAMVVLVGNVLAFTAYMQGVHLIGPSRGILYGFSEPVTAALITATVFHSPLTLPDILGFALIFLMIVLISSDHEDNEAVPQNNQKTDQLV